MCALCPAQQSDAHTRPSGATRARPVGRETAFNGLTESADLRALSESVASVWWVVVGLESGVFRRGARWSEFGGGCHFNIPLFPSLSCAHPNSRQESDRYSEEK